MTEHSTARLAPDAAARDARRRELAGNGDDGVIRDDEVTFVTRGLRDWEKAAVLATLDRMREAETERVRLVERRDREPWRRSQRVPETIADFLHGA